MIQDHSYGIIPLRSHKGVWEVFTLQHRSGYWGFPKGHANPGEKPLETASRELKEETNLEIIDIIPAPTLQEHYSFIYKGDVIEKTVRYFLAHVQGEFILQKEEVIDGLWIPLSQACEKMTYESLKTLCRQLPEFLKKIQ